MAVERGHVVVLTADRTLTADYHLLFDGMLAASQTTMTPVSLVGWLLMPRHGRSGVRAVTAPLGLRRIEAALLNGGFSSDEVVVADDAHLSETVGTATRVIGISAGEPAGHGMNSSTMTGIVGGRIYPEAMFRRVVAGVRGHMRGRGLSAKIVMGGPGAWQLAGDPEKRRSLGIDHVVTGYAEENIVEVFRALVQGESLPEVIVGQWKSPSAIPPIRSASTMAVVELSRGCGLGCSYCTIGRVPMAHLPPETILADVRTNVAAGLTSIAVLSEDFFRYGANGLSVNPPAILSLLESLRKIPELRLIQIDHANIISIAQFTDEQLKQVRDLLVGHSGARYLWVNIGVETAAGRLLKEIGGAGKMNRCPGRGVGRSVCRAVAAVVPGGVPAHGEPAHRVARRDRGGRAADAGMGGIAVRRGHYDLPRAVRSDRSDGRTEFESTDAAALAADSCLLSTELPLDSADVLGQPGRIRRVAGQAADLAVPGAGPGPAMERAAGLAPVESPQVTPHALTGDEQRLELALQAVAQHLIEAMNADGYWEGRLSSSALSTATAVSALALAASTEGPAASPDPNIAEMLHRGVAWLCQHQNGDGGWGDTIDSPSNLSTTLLAVAALTLAGEGAGQAASGKAEAFISAYTGGDRNNLAAAVRRIYGQDRTFAVPILMNCALAGLVSWEDVPNLPFELAAVPHSWYKLLRLQVVSYALPALIAVGMLVHHRHRPRRALLRMLRKAVESRVLAKLQRIQPPTGGFLEATPLTSFVAMSLIPLVGPDHPVAARCLSFIRDSQREDGSWPIDTNLSVWLTTAAVSALVGSGQLERIPSAKTAGWIRAQQYSSPHPYTDARPGGWAWTHLPGGVPDADDTSGAIIALSKLRETGGVEAGVHWLLELQNADGGWPTFCRGWGRLPFDQSAPDLTAHAIRALLCAGPTRGRRVERAVRRGFHYLAGSQQADGSWLPLWFGNQQHSGHTNPVVGTARVLVAWEAADRRQPEAWRGVKYLCESQNEDGGWGGGRGVASSMEETGLAVAALAGWNHSSEVVSKVVAGVRYLVRGIEQGVLGRPSPVGLYFASLWYSERLYPVIWTLEALGRARAVWTAGESDSATGETQRRLFLEQVTSPA